MNDTQKHIRKVLICTPMVHAMAKGGFMSTVFNIQHLLRENGIVVDFAFMECSDIVHGRNSMATHFLDKTKHTHLLFIDSDMEFEAASILKMLYFGANLSAIACPRRNLDVKLLTQKAYEAGQKGVPFDVTQTTAEIARYNLRYTWDVVENAQVNFRDGFVDVAAIGTGVMLIERFVLERMVSSETVKKRFVIQRDGSLTDEYVYGFFDVIYPREGVNFYSEDYSFCYRWTNLLQQKIWALIDAKIKHIGDYAFEGHYLKHFMDNEV